MLFFESQCCRAENTASRYYVVCRPPCHAVFLTTHTDGLVQTGRGAGRLNGQLDDTDWRSTWSWSRRRHGPTRIRPKSPGFRRTNSSKSRISRQWKSIMVDNLLKDEDVSTIIASEQLPIRIWNDRETPFETVKPDLQSELGIDLSVSFSSRCDEELCENITVMCALHRVVGVLCRRGTVSTDCKFAQCKLIIRHR